MTKQLVYFGAGYDILPILIACNLPMYNYHVGIYKGNRKIIQEVQSVQVFIYVDVLPHFEDDNENQEQEVTFKQIKGFQKQFCKKLKNAGCMIQQISYRRVSNSHCFEVQINPNKILRYYCGVKLWNTFQKNTDLKQDIQKSRILYIMGFFFEDHPSELLYMKKLIRLLKKCSVILVQREVYYSKEFKKFMILFKSKYRAKRFKICEIKQNP